MSAQDARDERVRKRQRVRQLVEEKKATMKLLQSKYGKSRLEKTADAVVCQIFAFLDVREHLCLSRSSRKIEAVSRLPKSMLVQVRIPTGLSSKVLNRLVRFRPTRLELSPTLRSEWMAKEKMPQLQELTFGERKYYGKQRDDRIREWFSHLVHLTKLKVAQNYVTRLPLLLPESLLHLCIFGCSNEKFVLFNSDNLLRCTAPNLQTLKLPKKQYYDKGIFKLFVKFPLLRELTIGYVSGRNKEHVDFSDLRCCKNLGSLTIGFDPTETILHWESLTQGLANEFMALRRLTICLYYRDVMLPRTAFDGLAQVSQLTHLKLVPYSLNQPIDIQLAINELVTELTTSSTILTSLLLDYNLSFLDASCLARLTTLTELQLTHDTHQFPTLPLLHTLHTANCKDANFAAHQMKHYKDQIRHLVLKDFTNSSNDEICATMSALLTMPHLTTLQLQLCPRSKRNIIDYIDISTYYRRHLSPLVQIETCEPIKDYE